MMVLDEEIQNEFVIDRFFIYNKWNNKNGLEMVSLSDIDILGSRKND